MFIRAPIAYVIHVWRRRTGESGDGRLLMNNRAELACASHQQLIEETAFDCDLAFAAGGKIDNYSLFANGDKLDGIESSMRQLSDALGDPEPAQDRPTRWIQTIAADFFARKFFALEKEGAQSSGGAKRRTGRSGGPAPDDRDIKYFHFAESSQKKTKITTIFASGFAGTSFPSLPSVQSSRPTERWRMI